MAACPSADTRKRILHAALNEFAQKGYGGASVRAIVRAAGVSTPVLYYYFQGKADLFRTLVDWAFDERLRLMRKAIDHQPTVADQLRELCVALFEFVRTHRELMRLAFASAVAAPGETPPEARCAEKGWRNLQFLQDLMEQAQARGELDRTLESRTLALGFAGLMHLHVLLHLVQPEQPLDRSLAESVVDIFLHGAVQAKGARRAASGRDRRGRESKAKGQMS